MNVLSFAERVYRLRRKLALSQAEFYPRYGISVRVGQSWEQGARERPNAAAIVLVMLIEEAPDTIAEQYRKAVAAKAPRQSFSTKES
jgi:DNA-binding transcriptional regulator YiaG